MIIEKDEFKYLEKDSSQTKTFTMNANDEARMYFSQNSSYPIYLEKITRNMDKNILLVKSRGDKIYALKVLNDDISNIVTLDKNSKKWDIIISGKFLETDEFIENYDISNDGRYAAVVVKSLWSVFSKLYIYSLHENRIISKINQCKQGLFSDDNNIYYQFNADESDLSQVNKVMCGKVEDKGILNIKTLLEIDELNNMDIIVSNEGKHVFVNVVTDYYKNDNIYFMSDTDEYMKELLVEDKGRNFYIGSDDENYYFESNIINQNFSILALKIGDSDYNNAVEVIPASEYKHAVTAKRAAFVNKGKILYIESRRNGNILGIADPKTGENKILNCCGEGIYFSDMYNMSINESETIYTTFENIMNGISIHEIDLRKQSTKLIYGEFNNKEIERLTYTVLDKELCIYKRKDIESGKTIISFNNNLTANIYGGSSNFNVKTSFREWILRGGIYVEYEFSMFNTRNVEGNILEVDAVVDFIKNNKFTTYKGIGLFQSDYLSSIALIYSTLNSTKIGGICTINGRTDLLSYINDTYGYLMKDVIGDPAVIENRDMLEKNSPYEIIKKIPKEYPSQFLCALEYLELVPSYHSKKMYGLLKRKGIDNVWLSCMEEKDYTKTPAEVLSFFENELGGDIVDIDCK